MIRETGQNSWIGSRVRKGTREGTVVDDINGRNRVLTVKMDDNEEIDFIVMNNIGPDNPEVKQWEFQGVGNKKWYQF